MAEGLPEGLVSSNRESFTRRTQTVDRLEAEHAQDLWKGSSLGSAALAFSTADSNLFSLLKCQRRSCRKRGPKT